MDHKEYTFAVVDLEKGIVENETKMQTQTQTQIPPRKQPPNPPNQNQKQTQKQIQEYQMEGRHWMATLRDTDAADTPVQLTKIVRETLVECGATILGYQEYVFQNGAVTFCFLLSESHCTVHTYPEYRALWMDCFTCGEAFDIFQFKERIEMRLQVGEMHQELIHRR